MYYIIVTHSVYADKTLQDGAKLLYGLILSLSQKDGFCYADNNYLAETLNNEPRTVQLYLSALKDKGYIAVELVKNSFRRITTQDTRVKLVPTAKNSTQAKIKANKQIAPVPEWLDEYKQLLADGQ